MKRIFNITLTLISINLFSQVGIGTEYPKKTLHIDGKSDNTSTIDKPENDIVIDNNGNLGIGIITPSNRLHILNNKTESSFKLVDGTQGQSKVLTVINSNGELAWNFKQTTKVVSYDGANFYTGAVNSDMKYIGRKVTLEPGKWLVRTNLLLATNNTADVNNGFYAKFSWAELDSSNNYIVSPDGIFGNTIGGIYNKRFGLTKGSTIIQNNSTSPKTYYLVTRTPTFFGTYNQNSNWWDLGGSFWRETSIIAFPAN